MLVPQTPKQSGSHPGLSRSSKAKYLLTLSEDEFRGKVVCPLLERRDLKCERDVCGPTEEGKDAIFTATDQLGRLVIHAVQTKKGNLNMSRKPSESLAEALTQLRTALTTEVHISRDRIRRCPDFVMLCASGTINESARRHIHDTLNDGRIRFYDANDLIADIDKHYHEFWWGIDAQRFPYLRRLREALVAATDTIAAVDFDTNTTRLTPITDDAYVTLYAERLVPHAIRRRGQVKPRHVLRQIPVENVLKEYRGPVLLAGEAGSGKTTALRRIALGLIDEALSANVVKPVPVILEAAEMPGYADALLDLAASRTAEIAGTERACFSIDDVEEGRVVLLVDALDEVPHSPDREAVLAKVDEFVAAHPRCPVVVTSRSYSSIYQMSRLRSYARYELCAMGVAQASQLVSRFAVAGVVPQHATKELLRRLQDVHGMTLSPLLLTVFAATPDYLRRDVPANISELFSKFTELMLGRWDKDKGLAQQFHAPLKHFLLSRIAFAMHQRKLTSIPLERFRTQAAAELKSRGVQAGDVEALLDEIVERSGLLRVADDMIEFRHHLLQEYFAGRGASETYLRSVISEEWWRKPVIFHFGMRPDDHEALAVLARQADGMPGTAAYPAAVTIGLALQACYLTTVEQRVELLGWVVRSLSQAWESRATGEPPQADERPLLEFLVYYIVARDAVACAPVAELATLAFATSPGDADQARDDLQRFWCLVGLIESGQLESAEPLVLRFRPRDPRLLLALVLGCMLLSKLRYASPEHRKVARRMAEVLLPKVSGLVREVQREMRGLLLEERQGRIAAVDATGEAPPSGDAPIVPA